MILPFFLLRRGSLVIMGGGGVWLSRRRVLIFDEDLRAERLAAMAADRRRVVTGIGGWTRVLDLENAGNRYWEGICPCELLGRRGQ